MDSATGGTAFNGVVEELKKLTTRVAHVLPVSDDGGSTAEIVRVLGKFPQVHGLVLFSVLSILWWPRHSNGYHPVAIEHMGSAR